MITGWGSPRRQPYWTGMIHLDLDRWPADSFGGRTKGMGMRAGRRARARIHRERAELLQRRPQILIVVMGMPAMMLVTSAFANAEFRWVLIGGAPWSFACLLMLVYAITGNTFKKGMGAEAEVWTSKELRRLRGRGFSRVDDIGFIDGNVDHVMVGQRAIFAVETKWSSDPWLVGPNGSLVRDDALVQATWAARRIRLLLKGNFKIEANVIPVLVLWGDATRIESGIGPDGVWVFRGCDLGRLPESLPSEDICLDARTATGALREYRKAHDRAQAKNRVPWWRFDRAAPVEMLGR